MIGLIAANPALQIALTVLVVGTLLFATGRLHEVLPRQSRLEEWTIRWTGLVQAVIVLAGLISVVTIAYPRDPLGRWLTASVLVGSLWTTRHALSDWVDGMVLRAEGTLRTGGQIRVAGARSRILRLGLRSAEVETEDGRLLRLPYGTLARGAIEVSPERTAPRSHTFSLDLPDGADAGELTYRMVAAALLSPWSSARPAPTVRQMDDEGGRARLEVTVYPLATGDASKVEEVVRATVVGG